MIETGAYGERVAGYLHLTEPPIHATLGFGRSKLAVTRLHAPNGFTDQTSPIPSPELPCTLAGLPLRRRWFQSDPGGPAAHAWRRIMPV